MGVLIGSEEISIELVFVVMSAVLFIVLCILYWIYLKLGLDAPSGEVPYEMIRASAGILCTIKNETGKMYVPVPNFVDGHFIAHYIDDYNDIIYLDEYFQ